MENHYHHHHHHHHHQENKQKKSFDDKNDNEWTNHELKHSDRSRWENHRWERERASLPAPQAHVPVTRPAWAASPAAFRERLRGACERSLAPGEGTQVGGLGRGGGGERLEGERYEAIKTTTRPHGEQVQHLRAGERRRRGEDRKLYRRNWSN